MFLMTQTWAAREIGVAMLATVLGATLAMAAAADAPRAKAPAPSRHQLMKDCMAKQQAANSGLPKDEMKSACKDVTKTEKQNDDAAQKQADKAPPSD